jgi:type IV pilus assembly protein PilF
VSKHSFFPILSLVLLLPACASLVDRTAKNQEKARIHLQLAASQYAQKDFGKAIDSAHEALKYDSEYPAAFNHLGIVYMETKRYNKSEEAFRKALELQSDYPEVYNNLGVLYNRQDKFAEAVPHFEKALSYDKYLTPENAFTNLGFSHYKLGNNVRAKAFHQKALDSSPEFCLANKNMGDVYAKEKNFKKAADFFQKAVTTCPLYEESHYKLGLALMKLGNKSVAKNQFEQLIERHKTGPYVERSQEVLKYLQ